LDATSQSHAFQAWSITSKRVIIISELPCAFPVSNADEIIIVVGEANLVGGELAG
jgi:hypothetical protein